MPVHARARDIMDSNITTFIAAAVLFYIGTSGAGLCGDARHRHHHAVFTAFTLTRVIVAGWVRMWRPKTVPIEHWKVALRLFASYPTTPSSTHALPARELPISAGAVDLCDRPVLHGTAQSGIDFKGGTLMEVAAKIGAPRPGQDACHPDTLNLLFPASSSQRGDVLTASRSSRRRRGPARGQVRVAGGARIRVRRADPSARVLSVLLAMGTIGLSVRDLLHPDLSLVTGLTFRRSIAA